MAGENEDVKTTPEDRGDLIEDPKAKANEEEVVTKEDEDVAKGKVDEGKKDDEGKKAEEGKKEDDEGKKGEEAKKDDDEGKKDDRNIRVPKFRLDAVTARARAAEERALAAEQRLKDLEAQLAKGGKPADDKDTKAADPKAALEAKLSDIDTRLAEAMKEGDTATVSKLMAESRQAQTEFIISNMKADITETRSATVNEVQESARLDSILTQLEADFPIFDENSDKYDQKANDQVARLQAAFIAQGNSPSDALIEAVNYVLPSLGYSLEYEDETPPKKDEGKKDDKRDKDTRKRNVETSKKQPPDLDEAGEDSTKGGMSGDAPNAMDLTDEEFDALPEATKRMMRGDAA